MDESTNANQLASANIFTAASATQTLAVLSAQEDLALNVDQLNGLVTAGILESNNYVLSKLLKKAIANLDIDKTTAGVQQLYAVINFGRNPHWFPYQYKRERTHRRWSPPANYRS